MSTRGAFIMRRASQEKAMHILSDAYPEGAGVDIVELVQSVDLNLLFDCLTEGDDADFAEAEDFVLPGDPIPFSYVACRMAVKQRKRLRITPEAQRFILDSLFCEYAYVIDLDTRQLMFFVGFQTIPQEGNPYGKTATRPFGTDRDYYPCRLSAVFSMDYVRAAGVDTIAEQMRGAEENTDVISNYGWDVMAAVHAAGSGSCQKDKADMVAYIRRLSERLGVSAQWMQNVRLENGNRVREFQMAVSQIAEAVCRLEKLVDMMK